MKYRAVHHDESGELQKSDLTSLQIARDIVHALQHMGLVAWIENEQNERVDEDGRVI